MNIPERSDITDLLVINFDGALWNEGIFFRLTELEGDKVWDFIKEYNKDKHLDLLCDYDNDPKEM